MSPSHKDSKPQSPAANKHGAKTVEGADAAQDAYPGDATRGDHASAEVAGHARGPRSPAYVGNTSPVIVIEAGHKGSPARRYIDVPRASALIQQILREAGHQRVQCPRAD